MTTVTSKQIDIKTHAHSWAKDKQYYNKWHLMSRWFLQWHMVHIFSSTKLPFHFLDCRQVDQM